MNTLIQHHKQAAGLRLGLLGPNADIMQGFTGCYQVLIRHFAAMHNIGQPVVELVDRRISGLYHPLQIVAGELALHDHRFNLLPNLFDRCPYYLLLVAAYAIP